MSEDLHYKLFRLEFLKKHPEAEEHLIRGFFLKFKKERAAK